MPMNWTAEADAKLMANVIQMCDVKLNSAQMAEIAKLMGPECTPKAISHRMTNFRKLANGGTKAVKAEDGDGTATKAAKTTKSGGVSKKNGKDGKKAAAARTPSPDGDAENYLTPPDTNRAKRGGAKRNYAELAGETGSDVDGEGEDDGLNKKIKIEVGEDIGEGLRQGPDDTST